jgi:hypothetical protein
VQGATRGTPLCDPQQVARNKAMRSDERRPSGLRPKWLAALLLIAYLE